MPTPYTLPFWKLLKHRSSESLQSRGETVFSCLRKEQSVSHCRSKFPTADANNLQCQDPFIRKIDHQLCTAFLSQLMKKDDVWCAILLPGKEKQQKSMRSYFRKCWVTYASWLLLTSDDCSFLPSRSVLKQFLFQPWFVIFRVYPRDTYCDFSICVSGLLLNCSN